jgi:sugar lactone lactonase YvrE
MLGSEYNWLISLTRRTDGVPRVSLAQSGLLTLGVAVFCLICVAAHAAPAQPSAGSEEAAWAITDMDGIIEGVALHPTTLTAYFSDVHNRCIWYRDVSGDSAVMRKLSADADGLSGVFALKFSSDGRTLWASSSAVPEMKGYTAADRGRGLLAAYDLATRKLRRTYVLPADGRGHVLGDFILAPDGTIYASDSTAPVIWRLPPGGQVLENWLENPAFKSLQGLVLTADGRSLYVADYSQGLWRINLATHAAALLPAPAGANLRGVDGLYAVPGGFIAVQNGLSPQRIIGIALDAAGAPAHVSVLLSGLPVMTDLSLGQVVNGRFHFIANSGWELYANPLASPAPRSVTILEASLP